MTAGAVPAVTIGLAWIDEWRPCIGTFRAWLDDREQARAAAFRDPAAAERFLVAHGLLRSMLGSRLGLAPRDVGLATDRDGRPRAIGQAPHDLHWSLAHTGGLAGVALAEGMAVGLDLERIDPHRADLALATRYLPASTVSAILAMTVADRPGAIALAWTRLEAEAKGRGRSLDALRGRERTGVLHDLDVGADHAATLWTPVPVPVIRTDRPLLASVA